MMDTVQRLIKARDALRKEAFAIIREKFALVNTVADESTTAVFGSQETVSKFGELMERRKKLENDFARVDELLTCATEFVLHHTRVTLGPFPPSVKYVNFSDYNLGGSHFIDAMNILFANVENKDHVSTHKERLLIHGFATVIRDHKHFGLESST